MILRLQAQPLLLLLLLLIPRLRLSGCWSRQCRGGIHAALLALPLPLLPPVLLLLLALELVPRRTRSRPGWRESHRLPAEQLERRWQALQRCHWGWRRQRQAAAAECCC